jgi:hypothetical protein
MQPVRLMPEPPQVEGPTLTMAAVLEHPDGERLRLWWRLPVEWREAVTLRADPFVVAFVFPMMQWRRDVVVEGAVSPSLLLNLEQFVAIWGAWMPDRYGPVEIHAREETEAAPPMERGQAVMPFSCGVDSSFTLYRHRRGLVGRRTKQIAATMVMHGFDIWLSQANAQSMYEGLLEEARAMVRSLDVPCIPVASNFHELPITWLDGFNTHLVSSLRLLAGRFDAALLPNDVAYPLMAVPWGSHPVSNPFLGSRHFPVIDDGGEAPRCEKIRLLAQWPEAMRYLRVCFENPGSHANCCRCEKCIRTILSFRAAGVPRPAAFARDADIRQIRRVRLRYEHNIRQWLEIVQGAERAGLGNSDWVRAIHAAIRRNRRRSRRRQIERRFALLRDRLRTLVRGSLPGRREPAARGR